MARTIRIGERTIGGAGAPTYVVAEMSANHGGRFEDAVRILHAARAAGADAVKLQTYTPDTMTLDCADPCFTIGEGTIWAGRTLHDLYAEAQTPWDWQPKLQRIANDLGLDLFSSPFDAGAVAFLETLGIPAYKIASFEILDIELLERVGATGRPVIVSTGMATFEEIAEAVRALERAGAHEIALLKCTSAYPALPEEMDLRTIPEMARAFDLPVGLSDHTLGVAVPVAAVALGACILEKHLTLSRGAPGPDSAFSLEPEEFRQTVEAVRVAERALGRVRYGPTPREAASRAFRRSIFVVHDVRRGELFTRENVRVIRPADGLPPRDLPRIIGRRASRDLRRGTPLAWDAVEGGEQ